MICICSKCDHTIGDFEALDDHSGIIVQCPNCKSRLLISNNVLGDLECLLEDPKNMEEEDHAHNAQIRERHGGSLIIKDGQLAYKLGEYRH